MIDTIDINAILNIAVEAGKAILTVYDNEADFEVSTKSDSSPLTKADKIANDLICLELQKLYP